MKTGTQKSLYSYLLETNLSDIKEDKFVKIEKIIGNVQHNQNHFPPPEKGEWFSNDVLAMDENGIVNLIFYNYDLSCWLYSEDGVTSHEVEEGLKFNWISIPEYLTPPK